MLLKEDKLVVSFKEMNRVGKNFQIFKCRELHRKILENKMKCDIVVLV